MGIAVTDVLLRLEEMVPAAISCSGTREFYGVLLSSRYLKRRHLSKGGEVYENID